MALPFEKCDTLAEFRAALGEVLWHPQGNETPENAVDVQRTYDASREWIRQFLYRRDAFPMYRESENLPVLPAYREGDPRAGLDDNLQWCDDAEKAVQRIPLSFDLAIIMQYVDKLKEFLSLLVNMPWPSEEAESKAVAELGAQPEFAKAVAALQKMRSNKTDGPCGVKGGVVTLSGAIEAKIALRRSVMPLMKAVERRCREEDVPVVVEK